MPRTGAGNGHPPYALFPTTAMRISEPFEPQRREA
jgi:hypothetical protein